jgi:hypothetical protein
MIFGFLAVSSFDTAAFWSAAWAVAPGKKEPAAKASTPMPLYFRFIAKPHDSEWV